MTFEEQYLTYAEYLALGGSAIGEMPFNLLEFEARSQIDVRTQNRLVNEEIIPQKVKMCDYHLIQKISSYSKDKNITDIGNIANESIDGYSVTYLTADKIEEIIKLHSDELDKIMMNDLYGVIVNGEAILYCGVTN